MSSCSVLNLLSASLILGASTALSFQVGASMRLPSRSLPFRSAFRPYFISCVGVSMNSILSHPEFRDQKFSMRASICTKILEKLKLCADTRLSFAAAGKCNLYQHQGNTKHERTMLGHDKCPECALTFFRTPVPAAAQCRTMSVDGRAKRWTMHL